MFNFFKKVPKKCETEDEKFDACVKLGILTEEERLRIQADRAEDRLKRFLAEKKKRA
jgi:hypothetical protein